MKLNIGDTIRRLRREREITQEEFSEMLGVSCQSVSRWENNACYPDIELIPVIAAFFGISTDVLMGVNEEAERAAVDEVLQAFQGAISVGQVDACIRIAREGVAQHPNNYALLNKLMYALFVAGSDDANIPDWRENMTRYDAEIVSLGERIIRYCPDIELRLEATARLAFQHCEMGRRAEGRALYETLPPLMQCRETAIWWALEEDEKLPHTRELIEKSWSILSESLYRLSHLLPHEEALQVLEKMDALEIWLYDGEVHEGTWINAKKHCLYAEHLLSLGREEQAVAHLRAADAVARAFDARPDERRRHTLLLGEQLCKKTDFDTADDRPLRTILHESWLTTPAFAAIRQTAAYQRIVAGDFA